MKLSKQVKPISYLKANTAELVRTLAEEQQAYLITQNGEAKAVIQDIASYEQTQETLALLKILAISEKEIESGSVEPVNKVFERLKQTRR